MSGSENRVPPSSPIVPLWVSIPGSEFALLAARDGAGSAGAVGRSISEYMGYSTDYGAMVGHIRPSVAEKLFYLDFTNSEPFCAKLIQREARLIPHQE